MEKSKSIKINKQKPGTIISLQQGKLPPQALDLEEAVIGAMLIDKKGVDEVIDLLQPDAFYKTAHQNIFESILNLLLSLIEFNCIVSILLLLIFLKSLSLNLLALIFSINFLL